MNPTTVRLLDTELLILTLGQIQRHSLAEISGRIPFHLTNIGIIWNFWHLYTNITEKKGLFNRFKNLLYSTPLILSLTNRAFCESCLTFFTYKVSAHWHSCGFFCHPVKADGTIRYLAYLVVEFQEHSGQVGYIGSRTAPDCLNRRSHVVPRLQQPICVFSLRKVKFPARLCFAFQRPLLSVC